MPPAEPLPAAQKRYLAAFDAMVRAWADDDEQAMREAQLEMQARLPAALGHPISIVGVIRRGRIQRGTEAVRAEIELYRQLSKPPGS